MIWLRSLLNPYVILGVAIACLFGLWKWEKRKTTALKTEAAALQKSVNMAEIELQNAEAINKSALDAVAQQAREVGHGQEARREGEDVPGVELVRSRRGICGRVRVQGR